MWTNNFRILKYGVTSFWRNRMISIAGTLVMTLTLIIISVFVILLLVVNSTIKTINNKIDLAVYFKDAPTDQEIIQQKSQVETLAEVKQVVFVDKNTAFDRWQERNIDAKLKSAVTREDNPLPRSLEIKVKNPDDIPKVATYFDSPSIKPMIQKTSNQENQLVITRLIGVTRFIQRMGIISSTVFIIISILIIFNTIRLAIYTRRDEIDIMKLVGANKSFIRNPFILEGIIHGILATVLSVVILYLGIYFLSPMISKYLGEILEGNLISYFSSHLWQVILMELLVGMLIGVGCSVVAIRRHLKV